MLTSHCPMTLSEYLSLPRWDRFTLHRKLGDFIEETNEANTAPPRQARREGW